MVSARIIIAVMAIGAACLIFQACDKSNSGSSSGSNSDSSASTAPDFRGTYISVEDEALTMVFQSGAIVVMTAKGVGSSNGTFTVDGEKIIVTIDGVEHTLIRDGDCIEDQLQVFGRLCKGGKAGAASNVSTRNVPTTPSGTYFAKNKDGEFKIEFKPGNKLTMTVTPSGGGKPDVADATFIIEGDTIHATLPQSVPMVLKFVNNTYESTSFGLPMKFVKQ